MNPSSLAVRCQNVVKIYDTGGQKVTALNGVNLDIAMGELMMLVGPSGCGKTTLISVIAGILDQDQRLLRSVRRGFAEHEQPAQTEFQGAQHRFRFSGL